MNGKPLRLALLGSTRGSTMAALLPQLDRQRFRVVVGVSNRPDCGFSQKLRRQNVPVHTIPVAGRKRKPYDQAVSTLLASYWPHLILMMGYMRIVGPDFVNCWRGRLLNIHPSLLPRHKGLMDLAVHQAVLAAGETQSGCTIHLVEEEVDGGRIVWQKRCPVHPDDDALALKARVQQLEVQAWLELLDHYEKEGERGLSSGLENTA